MSLNLKRDRTTATKANPTSEVAPPQGTNTKSHQHLQKQYTGNWIWRTVAALIDPEDTCIRAQDTAQYLGVTTEEVLGALEGLCELGIICKTEKGYRRVVRYLYLANTRLDPRSLLMDHVLISTQILGRLDPNRHSHYRTSFLSTNWELLQKFNGKLELLVKELIEESAASDGEQVVAISYSAVQVCERVEKAKKKKHI